MYIGCRKLSFHAYEKPLAPQYLSPKSCIYLQPSVTHVHIIKAFHQRMRQCRRLQTSECSIKSYTPLRDPFNTSDETLALPVSLPAE